MLARLGSNSAALYVKRAVVCVVCVRSPAAPIHEERSTYDKDKNILRPSCKAKSMVWLVDGVSSTGALYGSRLKRHPRVSTAHHPTSLGILAAMASAMILLYLFEFFGAQF